MFDLTIPHPKHTLKKYSTRQLKAWYERCALIEEIAEKEFDDTGRYDTNAFHNMDIARWTRWDIDDVLQERGISHEELGRILRLTKEDVNS